MWYIFILMKWAFVYGNNKYLPKVCGCRNDTVMQHIDIIRGQHTNITPIACSHFAISAINEILEPC